mgnify:CR=1 FL=1
MSGTRTVRLRYGRSTIELAVPAAAELLEPREPPLRLDRDSFRAGLAAELPEPLPSGPIVIVVADKTRLCGYPTVLPWLVELLAERGAGPERITFFIAYGVHARQSEAESLAAYGPVYTRYRFVHHDCDDVPLPLLRRWALARACPRPALLPYGAPEPVPLRRQQASPHDGARGSVSPRALPRVTRSVRRPRLHRVHGLGPGRVPDGVRDLHPHACRCGWLRRAARPGAGGGRRVGAPPGRCKAHRQWEPGSPRSGVPGAKGRGRPEAVAQASPTSAIRRADEPNPLIG